MVILKLKKIKGSSLIEIVVGLVIISIVFTMSVMVYVNLSTGKTSATKVIYIAYLKDYIATTKKNKEYFNEKLEIEKGYLQRTIEEISKNVILLKIEIRNSENKLIDDHQELIYQK